MWPSWVIWCVNSVTHVVIWPWKIRRQPASADHCWYWPGFHWQSRCTWTAKNISASDQGRAKSCSDSDQLKCLTSSLGNSCVHRVLTGVPREKLSGSEYSYTERRLPSSSPVVLFLIMALVLAGRPRTNKSFNFHFPLEVELTLFKWNWFQKSGTTSWSNGQKFSIESFSFQIPVFKFLWFVSGAFMSGPCIVTAKNWTLGIVNKKIFYKIVLWTYRNQCSAGMCAADWDDGRRFKKLWHLCH